MKLSEIIRETGVVRVMGDPGREIVSITADSRKVVPGSLFIAVRGFASDGHAYIASAIEKGAAAILYDTPESLPEETLSSFGVWASEGETPSGAFARTGLRSNAESGVSPSEAHTSLKDSPAGTGPAFVQVENSRHALALAADNFYGHPSSRLTLVGITGTNGKTTTVTLLYHLFMGLGYNCGLLSTIANYVGGKRTETENTTADPITINALLAEMVEAGCEYCFMEVSSIGVEQERVAGLRFRAGIFSNLTHDHLDYHKTFAEYLRCKKLFFDTLPADAFAITNIDDRNGPVMVQNTAAKIVTYSCRSLADHTARILEESFEGMLLRIDGQDAWTRLIGRHNAYNVLAIYTTAVCLGADPTETLVAISRLASAPGRLETLRGPRDLSVVIDYAHTPDALENVLRTLREIAPERQLVCLFGCGGDRDRTKRPEMAAIAEKMADRLVVTSDNCRTEDPQAIIDDIRKGLTAKGMAKSICIVDRREAIRTAILTSDDGATILLAGKGHENYQVIGREKFPFDEKEIVTETFNLIR